MTGGRLRRVARIYRRRAVLPDLRRRRRRYRHCRRCWTFHEATVCSATITAVQPPGRFGALEIGGADIGKCSAFGRSRTGDGNWINGGFFVLSPKVLDYIEGDETVFEGRAIDPSGAEGVARLPIDTWILASRWIRSATSASSKSCGTAGELLGSSGEARRPDSGPASGFSCRATQDSRELG